MRDMMGGSSKDTFSANSSSSAAVEAVRETDGPRVDERDSLPENDDVREMGAEGGPSSWAAEMGLKGGELGSYFEYTCTPPGVEMRGVERAEVLREELVCLL